MPYQVSKAAKDDLENIWKYTADNWSIEQADKYLKQILEEIKFLGEHPGHGKDYSHLRKNYRRVRVKSHIIFYRKTTTIAEIEVMRILHQSMDIDSILAE